MKRWPILVIIFFLLFYIALPHLSANTNFPLTQIKVDSDYMSLSIYKKVDSDSQDHFFKKIYESVYMGLSIYKLDALEKYTKERLIADLGRNCLESGVKFDLENIDIGKKGWTRYYPFSIGDKNFIMRIFLTEELRYQPDVKVLYEGILKNPAITFQILPSLNDILSDCRIKPFRTYSTAQVDSSP